MLIAVRREGEREIPHHADFVIPEEAGREGAHSTKVMLQCNTINVVRCKKVVDCRTDLRRLSRAAVW